MVIRIFEDNTDMPVSNFIRMAFCDDIVLFAIGSNNLEELIVTAVREYSETIVVYVDLVPDNEETIISYYSLCDGVNDRFNQNSLRVVIVPIVCSEYLVLRYLNGVNLTPRRGRKKVLGLLFFTEEYKLIHGKTFEKKCKGVLNGNLKDCFVNKQVNSGNKKASIIGKFYKEDCNCKELYCDGKKVKLCAKVSLFRKYLSDLGSSHVDKVYYLKTYRKSTMYYVIIYV